MKSPLEDMNPDEMAAVDKQMMEQPEGYQAEEQGETEDNLVCIPLKALAQPDESDAMHTPEPGDNITMTVDGVVDHVEGEMAYIKPMAVNSTPVGEAAAPGKLTPEEAEAGAPDDEADQLRNAMAGGMQ